MCIDTTPLLPTSMGQHRLQLPVTPPLWPRPPQIFKVRRWLDRPILLYLCISSIQTKSKASQ